MDNIQARKSDNDHFLVGRKFFRGKKNKDQWVYKLDSTVSKELYIPTLKDLKCIFDKFILPCRVRGKSNRIFLHNLRSKRKFFHLNFALTTCTYYLGGNLSCCALKRYARRVICLAYPASSAALGSKRALSI